MIFVGDGALLRQAIGTALERNYHVDGVLGNTEQLQSFCAQRNIPFQLARNTIATPNWITQGCSDGIGFSIDNSLLLPPRLLSRSGIDFFGIHSGIIPVQRGNPIVAAMFAILEGHKEYGVSLFRLDAGVDTGQVLTIRRFSLTPHLRLYELILRCSQLCQEVFEEFLERIVQRRYESQPPGEPMRAAYRLKDLDKLRHYQNSAAFDRATDLGVLGDALPRRELQNLCELRRSRQLSCVEPASQSRRSSALEFWRRQTEDVPTLGAPLIALGSPGAEVRSSYSFRVGTAEADALRTFSSATHNSNKHVLLACLLVLLARYSGNRDVCAGATRSDPSDIDWPLLPVRVRIESSQDFREVVEAVAQCCVEGEAQAGALTRDDCLRMAKREHGTILEAAWVEASFVTRDPAAATDLAEWLWSYEERGTDFHVSILPKHAHLELVERLAIHFRHLLSQLLLSPAESVFAVDLLTHGELQSLWVNWSQAQLPESACASVAELIQRQISLNPAATAVVDVDGSSLTYVELDEAANSLAHRIGMHPSSRIATVAIVLSRRAHVITAMLASWKARRTFVPLDPALPRERLEVILTDSGATVVVCERSTVSTLPDGSWVLLVLDEGKRSDDTRADRLTALKWGGDGRELAYVIYTSGSTGSPKGVMIEHRPLATAFVGTQLTYGLHPSDRVLGLGGLGSDAALWQLIAPLCWGSTVVLTQNTADPRSILRTIWDCAVTIVDLVPSLLHALIAEPREWPTAATALRTVVCGGESLPHNLLKQLTQLAPHCDVINAYGPTEACCQVTFHRCSADKTVSIGKAMPQAQLYVLSPEGKAVPAGVAGEIYIGGSTLARGYLEQPALTAEKFVRDPFAPDSTARMYRTGDLGRPSDG